MSFFFSICIPCLSVSPLYGTLVLDCDGIPERYFQRYCATNDGHTIDSSGSSSSKNATRAFVDPDFTFFRVEYLVSPNRNCSALMSSSGHWFSPILSCSISDRSSFSWFCTCFDFARYSTRSFSISSDSCSMSPSASRS
uniref:Putative secreted protein n=1 Tax=Anopheles triannulatus TaxID=58253 RepID=A0A2M4B4N9_9DIPT